MTIFNSVECGDCPVQSSCAAGSLVEAVEDETLSTVGYIYDHYRDDIVSGIVSGEDITARAEELRVRLCQAGKRAQEVNDGVETALADMVKVQDIEPNRHIELDDRAVATEQILDELGQLPHPTSLLEGEEVAEQLQAAAEDILRFSKHGICKALYSND